MNRNIHTVSLRISSVCSSLALLALFSLDRVCGSPVEGQVPAVVTDVPVNTVLTTVKVGNLTDGIVVSPDNQKVYVATDGNTVSVINAKTNTIEGSPLFAGSYPRGLALSSDGSKLYVANETYTGEVTIIDLANGNNTTTITGLGADPIGVALTPDGSQLWVCDYGALTVDVIDTANNQVLGQIVVGNGAYSVTFTPDGTKAYVASQFATTVSVVDTASRKVEGTIRAGAHVSALVLAPTGGTAYALRSLKGQNGEIVVADTTTDKIVKTISLGHGWPGNTPALLPGGQFLYVPDYANNVVVLLSTRRNALTSSGSFSCNAPTNIAIAPDGVHAYVTSGNIVTVVKITD